MRVVLGGAERWPLVSTAILLAGLSMLAASQATGLRLTGVATAAIIGVVLAMTHRTLLQWHVLLSLLIMVILFVPIKRFVLPGDLPFQLEPYRVVVAALVGFWLSALLIDPRVRLRRTGLEGPIVLILIAALGSILANSQRIRGFDLGSGVLKTFTFFLSFILVLYFIVSIIRRPDHVHTLAKVLVIGGAVLGGLAIIESRTGANPFNDMERIFPFLEPNFLVEISDREGRLRAFASAEHPIALGAALAMIAPFGIYLAHVTQRRFWWFATGILTMGALATVSRTGVLMLVVVALVFAWLRPQVRRYWPLALPILVAVHFALPGTLGTIKYSFFPPGGLVEEQRGYEDSGRVGDLGPTLDEVAEQPLFGIGMGTRIVTGPGTNARILDDQWLATALETGALGTLAWVWFFARLIRRLAREAREDASSRGWFVVALASAIAAYAVGMFTYDSFSFTQVTFLLFISAGLACLVVTQGLGRSGGWVERPTPDSV